MKMSSSVAIHHRKSLKKSQHILDHRCSTELAANLFRATQTEEKLRREDIQGKYKAIQTHFEVGTADHSRTRRHHAGRFAYRGECQKIGG
jgi:DNA-damage-inducible protein D